MRVFLDTNVLYPSILRGILLGFAQTGYFMPLWSDRVIEEWHRAAMRNETSAEASIEIALFKNAWASGWVRDVPPLDDLLLPDVDDHHVVEAAVVCGASAVLTANNSDFPTKTLRRYDLLRFHPDRFLKDAFLANTAVGKNILEQARMDAEKRAGQQIALPALLKRLRLGQLRKAVLDVKTA
ncbi:MAG: PIN domain-containing protein [Pseudomonadota bacterium]